MADLDADKREKLDSKDFGLPEKARTTVDEQYVLAAAGLLGEKYPVAAATLLRSTAQDPGTRLGAQQRPGAERIHEER